MQFVCVKSQRALQLESEPHRAVLILSCLITAQNKLSPVLGPSLVAVDTTTIGIALG